MSTPLIGVLYLFYKSGDMMARRKTVEKKVVQPEKVEGHYCLKCKKVKKTTDFYSSRADLTNLDGRMSVCKQCLVTMVDENDLNSVKSVLRQIDRPFISYVWKSAKDSKRATFGDYMRQINSLFQFKDMSWEDGLSDEYSDKDEAQDSVDDKSREQIKSTTREQYVNPLDDFDLTPELKMKWGTKFSKEDIFQMEVLWQDMMEGYIIELPSERDYLKKCCITSVLANKAYEEGKLGEGDKLSKSYNDLMKAANFAPSTRNSADKTGGVNSFSELFETIEKDGFIPLWPDLDNDLADKTLDHLKRWTRDLVMGDPALATLVETQINKNKREENNVEEIMLEDDIDEV